jgi:hypothetical protein
MSIFSILVTNNAPGCVSEIEQQLTVTACTQYLVSLTSNSTSLGPFNIYLDDVIYYSAVTRNTFLDGVVVNVDCTTPTPTPTPTNTPTQTQTPTGGITPTPTPTNTGTPTNTPTNTETPTNTPTNTPTPTQTQTQGLTPTPTPTNTGTPTQTPTNTETPTQTPTNTQTPTVTPSQTTNLFKAYLFPEALDSTSQDSLGQFMFDNGADWYGFLNSGGIPGSTNYESNMLTYIQYPGWTGSSGNFITSVANLTGSIRQVSGSGIDTFGCSQNQYTFGTIEVTTSNVNPNVQYDYSIWIPLAGVGNTLTNMTVDVGSSSPCSNNIFSDGIPDVGNAAIDIDVPIGSILPAGTYRVLWNFVVPSTLPLGASIYFKGDTKS